MRSHTVLHHLGVQLVELLLLEARKDKQLAARCAEQLERHPLAGRRLAQGQAGRPAVGGCITDRRMPRGAGRERVDRQTATASGEPTRDARVGECDNLLQLGENEAVVTSCSEKLKHWPLNAGRSARFRRANRALGGVASKDLSLAEVVSRKDPLVVVHPGGPVAHDAEVCDDLALLKDGCALGVDDHRRDIGEHAQLVQLGRGENGSLALEKGRE
mmetsp:Transcript_32330/g.80491  ORF Transcript_32330/g.80491 Transcript_32330/m.80491 type:complete len:216 (-) Transcript_32330:432-1079(-)